MTKVADLRRDIELGDSRSLQRAHNEFATVAAAATVSDLPQLLAISRQLASAAVQALPQLTEFQAPAAELLSRCHAAAEPAMRLLVQVWSLAHQLRAVPQPVLAAAVQARSQEESEGCVLAAALSFSQVWPWTTATLRQSARELQTLLLPTAAAGQAQLIAQHWSLLLELLQASQWQQRPAVAPIVTHTLSLLRHPHMGPLLASCLPLVLQWIDYYRLDIRLLGLKAAQMILSEVRSSCRFEWRRSGGTPDT